MPDLIPDDAIGPDVWDSEDPPPLDLELYLELRLAGHDPLEAQQIIDATWESS